MSWTYSFDPSASSKDAVRFYLQDTDQDDQMMSDEEINFIVTNWTPIYGSNIYNAAVAADVLAARYAREMTYSADGVSAQAAELQDKFAKLAVNLRTLFKASRIGGGPEVFGASPNEQLPSDIAPLHFGTGMNDNLRAGQQDYAGAYPPNSVNDGNPTSGT